MKRLVLLASLAGSSLAFAGDKVWNNYPETRAEIAELRTTAFAVGVDAVGRGSVLWMKSCLSGTDFSKGAAARPLFRVKFVPCENAGGRAVELSAADAGSFRCETLDRRLRLVYSGFPQGVCDRVECTLAVERNDNFLYWDIAVKSAPGWKLVRTSYPELPLAEPLKRTGDPLLYAERDGSLFCKMNVRGGRVATTAYDLGPGEKTGPELLAAIRLMEDSEGEEAEPDAPRVLFLGNSITGTGPANRWDGCWGMCASWPQKDFVHLVVKGLEHRLARRVSWRRRNLATWERNLAAYDVEKQLKKELSFKPDVVIIALGENVPSFKSAEDRLIFGRKLRELALLFKTRGAKLLIRSPFWEREGHREIQRAVASEVGAAFVDLKGFGQSAEWQAQGSTTDAGVAWHPGDAGMRRIADEVLRQLR